MTLGSNRLNKNVVNHYNAENQLVLELEADGKVKKRYVRGNDLVFSDKGNGTKRQYYVTDPHGNVVQLTDGNGKVTKTYEYDSFGNEVKPEEKDDNPFRYCGEYYDKETGEVYLRARYYQPEKGRFLTRDTYTGEEDEPESLHLYAYCGNDGVNAWDPSGHSEVVLSGGVFTDSKKKDGKYYYHFIDTALKKIVELRKKGKKSIHWYVADHGWSSQDKRDICEAVYNCGGSNVILHMFKNIKSLINQMNNKKFKKDKVKSVSIFAHGEPYRIMFGYNRTTSIDQQKYDTNPKLDFYSKHIKKLKKKYYNKKLSTTFYSCRAGASTKYDNNMNLFLPFAQKWVNHLKGEAQAYVGRTSYDRINVSTSDNLGIKILNAIRNRINKPKPSLYYPVGANKGERFKIFRAK